MLKISHLKTDNLESNCITDNYNPVFSFSLESDKADVRLESAVIKCNGWSFCTKEQIGISYMGEPLEPFSTYKVTVEAVDNYGEKASSEMTFETGRLNAPWSADWITDAEYHFKEKKVSPIPMYFKKRLKLSKQEIKRVRLYSTALGIYELKINNKKIGKDYFAPGFTSYKNQIQYQVYDITKDITDDNELLAIVSGGWAVGSFIFTRKNRITAKRQAFLCEIIIEYKNGNIEVIGTDDTWEVAENGNYKMADFYDGETYDATIDLNKIQWRKAKKEKLRISPKLIATYGPLTRAHETFKPVNIYKAKSGTIVYDFGQNFAGVINAVINGKKGQTIVFKHAEVLLDGELFTLPLRSAKATATYICKEGNQTYSPCFTYMGFRYVGVMGIEEKDLELSAFALYSDIPVIGNLKCSNDMLNKLQSNIVWSGKSNFVDIPTDCPQRDERMGWTGDVAIFASTACFNFDMRRFLDKWLKDLRSEQTRGGGIPNAIPAHGFGFPTTMPKKAVAFWGDACIFVPWALYLAYGDLFILKKMYPVMKKYIKACKFWAGLFSFGKKRYIWNDIPSMQFGDWLAPDIKKMSGWQARCKWTGTAVLAYSSELLSKIAGILGEYRDSRYYLSLSKKVKDAYISVLTDGKGKLLSEFQTAYVLPLHFNIFPEGQRKKAAENLVKLIQDNDYCIGTGFPGTPYVLFALADNGYVEEAYKMLLNEKCPSWLFQVKAGGTTIWERWDALKEDGTMNLGAEDGTHGMVSFNHYAYGAVGDFLYRRVLGIETIQPGFKFFKIEPILGGGLTFAKGSIITSYGKIACSWKIEEDEFTIEIEVPVGTTCSVILPDKTVKQTGSGNYSFSCKLHGN